MKLSRRVLLASLGGLCLGAKAAAANNEPWPRSFHHAFGTSVIARPAQRVVSLGFNTHDTLLALDLVPLAVRRWYGDAADAIRPWAMTRLAGAHPMVLTGELNIELIAALEPDLIIAVGSGINRAGYDLLSKLAPVLTDDADMPLYAMGWREITRLTGRAIGKESLAEDRIEDLQRLFADARARHPEWHRKSGIAAYHFNGITGIFSPSDARSRFLAELGFSMPTAPAGQFASSFHKVLSPEDLSPLEADVLLWITSADQDPSLAALPMRKLLSAHIEGREVYANSLISAALSYGSILSLPYALRALEADIAAAADGDPRTAVASAAAAGITP
jgi:iron complex transport system substrate-binding protein